MKKLFYKSYLDLYSTLNEIMKKGESVKKTIKSCETLDQTVSSLNMLTAFGEFTEFSKDNLIKRNKLVNFLTFGAFKIYAEDKIMDKIEILRSIYFFEMLNYRKENNK